MFVGEQSGDREDIEGKPFVGPVGSTSSSPGEASGGSTRLPAAEEISACRPWLQTELDLVKPRVLVALGATAAQALLGRGFRVTTQRGQFLESDLAPLVTATVHPSSILRAPDEETRHQEMRRFVADLKKVARELSPVRPGD